MSGLATLLLLGDGRLPSGGHAHSGGLESAVAAGRVHDLAGLESFLDGRLATAGFVAAAFVAKAVHCGPSVYAALDAGLDARTPSPALRRASRTQGRALVRAGRAMWALPDLPGYPSSANESRDGGPHQPVALGALAGAAGLSPEQGALLAAYGSVSGPASAAIRLLGLDPYPVHALLARLAAACETTAARAVSYVDTPVDQLPAAGAPLLDITAEHHATWEVRLFAS